MIHVCCDYKAEDGYVFLEWESCDSWIRRKLDGLQPEMHKLIIKCSKCDKPAVVMDHLWPWEQDHCRCSDHPLSKDSEED